MKSLATALLAGALGVAVGYWLGQERWYAWGMRVMKTSTTGVLNWHIVVLAELRAGETERAIDRLEQMVDQAVITLRPGGASASADADVSRTLSCAKLYRRLFPPPVERAELVRRSLEGIPEPTTEALEACASACRALEEPPGGAADDLNATNGSQTRP